MADWSPPLRQTSGDQEKVNDRGRCGVNEWFEGKAWCDESGRL